MKTLREQMTQQMQLKGYSEKTTKTYVLCISLLSRYYNLSPDLISIEQVRDYIQYCLVERKLSKAWLNQTISALKILYIQVLKREWNIIDIPRPRRERRLPVVFSREEVEKILKSPRNVKHRAFLMLTYSSGLRISEVCNLKVSDIDSSRMLMRVVQAKGNKDRYTVLSPVALKSLRIYWELYKPKIWLFEGHDHSKIAIGTARAIFKKALSKSGVTKKVGIHTLRHSFATHLLEQGVSLPIIQQLLGHKSLRTTSGYLHVQQYSINAVRSPLDTLSI
jgi:integrase/recombinase XerD